MTAYADNTLLGLAQINNNNLADIAVDDLLLDAPLLARLYAQKSSYNTIHQYLKRTGAASGTFRAVNTGVANTAAQREMVEVALKVLDASFARDKAVATGYKGGAQAYMAMEIAESLAASFYEAEKQLINGTANQSLGFAGLKAALNSTNNAMVYNAAGTNSGAVKTSLYAIRSGANDVSVILGQDGNIEVGDIFDTQIVAPDFTLENPKMMPALGCNILGWLALQLGSIYSAGRIANITNESGKTLDDDKIAGLLAKFPAGRKPTMLVCNQIALEQLRASRTATNATGAPAPIPTEAFGIPFVVTDAIGNADSIVTT